MYIKGVNLGNWLVLEKWMSTGVFAGTDAADEFDLPRKLPREIYEERIRMHRSEYITERDFVQIRSWGMNAVRIPVPYFLFGDCPPYIGCVKELDQAFSWAEKTGLRILIDLHTVPGGQNGFDNGGISGVCRWASQPDGVEFALSVLERLADRYGRRPGLWGIEILNEPLTETVWNLFNIAERYKPADPAMAEKNAPISFDFLRDFYQKACERIRRHMDPEKVIVFHDGFDIGRWEDFMQGEGYENVVLDTHQYLMVAETDGCEQTVEGYKAYIREHFEKDLARASAFHPVICGEWCLFNSLVCGADTRGGQSVLNGVSGAAVETFSAEEKRRIYLALSKAQLSAWRAGNGYFYWNYKLLLDTVNEPGWIGWDAWDLGRCISEGWFWDSERGEF